MLNCRFLHHQDPYLKMGPFKEDHILSKPYVVIFRDILTENDINELIKESSPKLSQTRSFDKTGGATSVNDIHSGKYVRVIHKTVQAWLKDVQWPKLSHPEDYVGKNYTKMKNVLLWKLGKRISLATQLVTDTQTAGSQIQVTNYGLAGTYLSPSKVRLFCLMEILLHYAPETFKM